MSSPVPSNYSLQNLYRNMRYNPSLRLKEAKLRNNELTKDLWRPNMPFDGVKAAKTLDRMFSKRDWSEHLSTNSAPAMTRADDQSHNETQWPYSKLYSIREVITFDGFKFEFDKTFLDHLKRLKKEISIFVTEDSKQKSKALALSVPLEENTSREETLLVTNIVNNISKVNKFIAGTEQRLRDKELKSKQKQKKKKQKTKSWSPETVDMRKLLPDELKDQADNNEIIMVRSNVPTFLQQYMDSLGISEYRFSRKDIMIALGAIDDDRVVGKSADQCSTRCSSQASDASDDLIILDEPFPQRNQSQSKMIENWSQTGYYNVKAECVDIEPEQLQNNWTETWIQQSSQKTPQSISSQVVTQKSQQIEIVNRHKWANTKFNISTGVKLKDEPQNKVRTQLKRHKQIKFVLEKILALIQNKCFATKRDLYYQNVMLFDKSQRVVDEIIDDLACSLRASRAKLHIVSSTRGLVFGHLRFQNTNGVETDCLSSPNGINIPNDTSKLSRFRSKALFVLIIEKDATFQQLIDLNIHLRYPIIMITGHGYPDMNTRAFVQILWNTFEIPIFGLVDGDAHGLEILCTFKHGSLALSYESHNLVVPAIKWIGIMPTDIREYRLSKSVQIPLNDCDRKKIKDLKQRNYMVGNKYWTKQLDILLKIGYKVEIQSLAEHDPSFLFNTYLPNKIRYGKWY